MKINGISNIQHVSTPKVQNKIAENKKDTQTTSFGNFNPFLAPCNPEDIEKHKINFAKELNDKKDELYSILDNMQVFSFEEGKPVSILTGLNSLFSDNVEYKKIDNLLHKTPEGNVENIKNNGFDTSKISKTEYGPGVYFGFSEGALDIYSGVTLKAEYEGKTSHGANIDKYNDLKREMVNSLCKQLNKQIAFSQFGMAEHEVFSQFVNEYCMNKIANELGIDGATTNSREGYFIVFNKDSIKNIEVKN